MARICATVANSNPFRTGPPVQEKEFLPDYEREGQTDAEMHAWGKRVASMGNLGNDDLGGE